MLTYQDLEVINLELTSRIQEMENQIRNGKQFNDDTIKHLTQLKLARDNARRAARGAVPLSLGRVA